MRFATFLLGASALLTPTLAQTWTACNPMNGTCPNDPALGTNHTFHFNTSSAVTNTFNITAGTLEYGADGAEFTVAKRGDSPTIQSNFYIFFGSVSVVMKAATGQGIISSIVLESDDLDEVDWEFMGGNATFAETNYFGKGNTTAYDRAVYYPVSSDVRENFHNYTVIWTAEKLEWLIDSNVVRTLMYADANGGKNFPQTPMNLRLGIWAGGDPSLNKYTIEWAGGETDFTKGPYTMYVQSAEVNDYSTGSAYEWTDTSGDWQSIKTIAGNSTAAKTLAKADTPTLSMTEKFNALPQTTKVAVYAGGGAAAALLVGALAFVCFTQRRKGRQEREAYNATIEKEREDSYNNQAELKNKGFGGWDDDAVPHQGYDSLPKMPENVSMNDLHSPTGYSGAVSPPILEHPVHNGIYNGGGGRFNSGGYQRF